MSLFRRLKDWWEGADSIEIEPAAEHPLDAAWRKRLAELGDWQPSNGWLCPPKTPKAEIFKINNPRYEQLKRRRAKMRAGR